MYTHSRAARVWLLLCRDDLNRIPVVAFAKHNNGNLKARFLNLVIVYWGGFIVYAVIKSGR